MLEHQMDLETLANEVGQLLKRRHLTLVTAESCTGGWVAQAVTAIPGSSQWFDRGFVVYTNLSKQESLGVAAATLLQYGAVSEQTVRAMAECALTRSRANVSIAVSGIAGPDGAAPGKPVGTVWLGWAGTQRTTVSMCHHFDGDRQRVRQQSVVAALEGLIHFVNA
jgi:nicotinamide-nucleotide amidase